MSRELVEDMILSGVDPKDIDAIYQMGRESVMTHYNEQRGEWASTRTSRSDVNDEWIEGLAAGSAVMHDAVNQPKHYTAHPSGIECIQITEHMGFCLGNAVKYIWRADLKNDAIEDLRKARWYLDREIELREKEKGA